MAMEVHDKLVNRVIRIETLQDRGYWLQSHYSQYVPIIACSENDVYGKLWSQFRVKKVGEYVCLESLRYPNHYLDAHHSKWVCLTYSTYPDNKSWALWKIFAKDASLNECLLWSYRYQEYMQLFSNWNLRDGSVYYAALAAYGELSRFRIFAPMPVLKYKTIHSFSNELPNKVINKIKFDEKVTHTTTKEISVSSTLSVEISCAFEAVTPSLSSSVTNTLTRSQSTTKEKSREIEYDINVEPHSSVEFQQLQGFYGPFIIATDSVRTVDTTNEPKNPEIMNMICAASSVRVIDTIICK